jgi:hypothetical protein
MASPREPSSNPGVRQTGQLPIISYPEVMGEERERERERKEGFSFFFWLLIPF